MRTAFQSILALGIVITLVGSSAYAVEADAPDQEETAMVTLVVDGMQKSRSGAT